MNKGKDLMFQIVTREDQISSTYSTNNVNQDAFNKSKLYPGLLPYFIKHINTF